MKTNILFGQNWHIWVRLKLFWISVDPVSQDFPADCSDWGFPCLPNIAQTQCLSDRLGLPRWNSHDNFWSGEALAAWTSLEGELVYQRQCCCIGFRMRRLSQEKMCQSPNLIFSRSAFSCLGFSRFIVYNLNGDLVLCWTNMDIPCAL